MQIEQTSVGSLCDDVRVVRCGHNPADLYSLTCVYQAPLQGNLADISRTWCGLLPPLTQLTLLIQ
jgi:hypothetical protein